MNEIARARLGPCDLLHVSIEYASEEEIRAAADEMRKLLDGTGARFIVTGERVKLTLFTRSDEGDARDVLLDVWEASA